ncbi:MAG: bifunctional phosphoglucose/phosphomannose isomerase [Candidatus Omnitrophica bacterium]|nr:bifunctional phosphoglucose/phosphomannose isomerase [Candidatus Omnitrophota bacterium]
MNNLNDIELIRGIDRDNMGCFLTGFADQCLEAEQIGLEAKLPRRYINKEFKNVVLCGMGGSAISADLIREYLKYEIKLPVIVNKDYRLADFVGRDTLLIVLSYSGNTEETVSAFRAALKKKAAIVVFSSGGKLKRLSLKSRVPFIKIPAGYAPRCALGYLFFSCLVILSRCGMIKSKKKEIKKTVRLIRNVGCLMTPHVSVKDNEAKRIAEELYGRFVVIYGSTSTTEVPALRLRSQLAENSKSLSSVHLLPEMNHNEIVGWQHPGRLLKNFAAVFLTDEYDLKEMQKRIKISWRIIEKTGAKVIGIRSAGDSLLSRMFSLICISDWISYYLAVLNGVNPMPVKMIEYLKKEISRR